MPLTTKDSILSIDDMKIEEVFVPVWGDSVFVRTLTSFERDHFEATMIEDPDDNVINRLENFRARLCALGISDEKGDPVFTETDARKLGKKSSQAMGVITEAIQKLNGMTQEDQDNLVKNSETTPSDDGDSSSA